MFPIPMRGNERIRPARAVVAEAFPIPMRGNEVAHPPCARWGPLAFPIPMRGNELWLHPEPPWRREVSNPHEG